jgi:asparagine synthase (glutamine-hydrolysing)
VQRLLDRQMTRFPSLPSAATHHAEECYRNATAGHYQFHAERQSSVARMYGLQMAFPFRDRDLLAFLMAVPGEVVHPRGVPKGLLRAALCATVPAPIRDRRWKADFTAFNNAAVASDHAAIARLLTRESLSVKWGFVDGQRIALWVSTLIAGLSQDENAEAGWRLSDAAALELWLRRFFGDGDDDGDPVEAHTHGDRARSLCTI